MKLVVAILFGLVLQGCAAKSWNVFDARDPAIASKLKLGEADWREIEILAAQEAGWVPYEVLLRKKGLIEIDFRRADDPDARKGGIVRHYSKKEAHWQKLDYDGSWGHMLSPLQKEGRP